MSCSGGEDSVCTQVGSIKGDFITPRGGKEEESMISFILPGGREERQVLKESITLKAGRARAGAE